MKSLNFWVYGYCPFKNSKGVKPYLIDIRETYDLILNNSSEEDIVDTEIVDKTETNSVMNLETDANIVTETNSVVIESEVQLNTNDFLSKNMDDLLNGMSESSGNNSEINLESNSTNESENSNDEQTSVKLHSSK